MALIRLTRTFSSQAPAQSVLVCLADRVRMCKGNPVVRILFFLHSSFINSVLACCGFLLFYSVESLELDCCQFSKLPLSSGSHSAVLCSFVLQKRPFFGILSTLREVYLVTQMASTQHTGFVHAHSNRHR